MTYLNGKDILPEELFIQVQEYCAGELIYIPKKDGTRQSWGNSTGIRKELDERNQMIREKKKNGCSLTYGGISFVDIQFKENFVPLIFLN